MTSVEAKRSRWNCSLSQAMALFISPMRDSAGEWRTKVSPEAPSVTFRYMYFLIGEEDIEEPDDPLLKRLRQWMRGMRIVGMCLANGHDCDNDKGVMPYTTYWGRPVGQRPAAIADPA